MALDKDIALLSTVGLFQGFTADQLRLIAFGAERERIEAGALLFRTGELAAGGYVVAQGQIDLVLSRGGREMLIESVGEGGLVGEMALITSNKRASDAVARVDSEVLNVPRALFHRMLREYPETAAFLHGRIAQLVKRLMGQIDEVNARLGEVSRIAEAHARRHGETVATGKRDGGK